MSRRESKSLAEDRSDADLVVAAQAGDKKAFVEIVARHQGMVTGVTLAILGNFEAGEDAAQEAFVAAWKKIDTLKDPDKLRPWLTQIARNTAISHRRRQRPGEPLEDEFADAAPGPDELAASDDERATVLAALEALPEKFRLPMVLYYREGESVRAVAEALELSEDVVKKRLAKGRELLRDRVLRLVDSVVGRSLPSAVFTAAVAATIGALIKPSAIAATAFSAGQAAKPIAATATAMTTSKFTLASAALVAAICLPVGYTTHMALASDDRQSAAPLLVGDALQGGFADPSESEIVAEWRRLRERHGEGEGALAALHAEIDALPSELRRQAFHILLATEWARIEPHDALAFYGADGRPRSQRRRFIQEWAKLDVNAAIDGLLGGGPSWNASAYPLLNTIASEAPDRLVEVFSLLHPQESYWVGRAFQVFARNDLEGACRAAMELSGHRRKGAVIGIAEGWAEIDARAAFDWGQSLADRGERSEAVRAVLATWANREPFAVLEHIENIAPGDRLGRSVLGLAAAKDFDAALAWVGDNAGLVSTEGMAGVIGERLARDPIGLLTQLEDGGVLLPMLDALRGQEALTSGSENGYAIWDWLFEPQRSDDAVVARGQIILASQSHDAMRLVDRIPIDGERHQLMGEVVARAVEMADDPFADRPEDLIQRLLADASTEWRRALIEEGIANHSHDDDPGARDWLAKLPLTAEERAEFEPSADE